MSEIPQPFYVAEDTAVSRAVVDRVCASARAENRAAAQRLEAIGELWLLRLRECGEREDWVLDAVAAVTVEVAAALHISHGLAGSFLGYARAMRERLPQVAKVFLAGDLDYRLFQAIVYRTDLIIDSDVLVAVDGQLAVSAPRWPSLTPGRLAAKIDKIVARLDVDAVRRRKDQRPDRELVIWDSGNGTAEIRGCLRLVDGLALDTRADALAATVCAHDPRSREQRRSDAMGALAVGADRLRCECGRVDCGAGAKKPATPAVVHVIAEQATVDGIGDTPGSLVGVDGLIPPEVIAELAASAKLVPLVHPADAPPECGYTPSKALADFVRCRDMTCRWPGCAKPAIDCDLDHTIPYGEGGPTHASNLKCYCRIHHLVKTFGNWTDQQLPDGTLILTAPSGQTYVTFPGSALLFPSLCAPAGDPPVPAVRIDDRCGDRSAMLPRRRRTRAQNRAARIDAERKQNRRAREARRQHVTAQYFGSPPTDDTADDDPPPF